MEFKITILGAFPPKGNFVSEKNRQGLNQGRVFAQKFFFLSKQEMLDPFCRHWHLFVLWGLFDRIIGRATHAIVVDDSSKKTKERLLGIGLLE